MRGLGSGNETTYFPGTRMRTEKGGGGNPSALPAHARSHKRSGSRDYAKSESAHGGGGQDTTCQPVFIRTWLQIDFGCSAGREVSLLTYGCLIYKRRLIAAENTFLKKRKSLENCNQY